MDQKLRQVALESFNYRHEAEFAAGFLRDAGIPFRLQIEDPALGLSAVNSATLWVAAMDERRARQVLDHDMAPLDDAWHGDDSWPEDDRLLEGLETDDDGRGKRSRMGDEEALVAAPSVAGRVPSAGRTERFKSKSELTLRQRTLAVVLAAGAVGTLGIDVVRGGWGAWAVSIAAAGLVLTSLLGRAPSPLKGILQALSGDAP